MAEQHKDTPSIRAEFWAEMVSQLKAEFHTVGGVFSAVIIIGTSVAAIAQAWGSVFMWGGAPKLGWLSLMAALCATISLMWKSHSAITSRNRTKIAELQGKRGNLRMIIEPELDPDSHAGAFYLRGKVINDGVAVNGVTIRLLGFKGDAPSKVERDFDLLWAGSEHGAKNLGVGEERHFDIGAISGLSDKPMVVLSWLGAVQMNQMVKAGTRRELTIVASCDSCKLIMKAEIEVLAQAGKKRVVVHRTALDRTVT